MKKKETPNKILVQCYFDPDVKNQAFKIAESNGTPLAYVIRKLVAKWIEENKTNEK